MSLRSSLVPCLLALTPFVHSAVNINDDVELKVSMRLQTRIEMASASDAAGDDYDVWEGDTQSGNPNDVNMMIRRARLYLKGKYKDDIKFNLTFSADEMGVNDDRDSTTPAIRYAWVSKSFKTGDMKHTIKAGLDKTWFISGDTDSSSRMLFATGRLSGKYNNGRQIGLSYRLSAPLFNLGVEYSDDEETKKDNAPNNNDTLWSIRGEFALSEDTKLKKRKESFLGKDGFGHLIGFGFGGKIDGSDDDGDKGKTSASSTFTIDYNLHWNQLSLNADFVASTAEKDNKASAAQDDVDSTVFLVQAGWAIPMEDLIIEPALRLTFVDKDTDNDDERGVYEEEGGASGTYVDAGVNIYFNGHNNKLNIGLLSYSPEDGDGDATVFRVQHQLNF